MLESYGVELLVLAGYMLITGPDLCARFAMLNLHPALPGGPRAPGKTSSGSCWPPTPPRPAP